MLPDEARALLGKALFVDVREPYEFDAGHIEGSVHIPIGEIGARFEELRSGHEVIVVCQVGQRSGLVADFLRQQGMNAHNLDGGLSHWSAQGLALSSDAGSGQVIDGWARDLSGQRLAPDPEDR